MIVEESATTQPKRSEAGSAARGPAPGSPATTSQMASSAGRTSSGSRPGARAARRASSIWKRARRKSSWRQKITTPTLIRSPRSTDGTRRRTVYWNSVGLATGAGLLRLAHEGARGGQARGQEAGEVTAAAQGVVAQPRLGHERHGGVERGLRRGHQALVGLVQRPR